MEIIVERCIAKVLFGTVNHHRSRIVVVTEAQIVMVDGVTLHVYTCRVGQINPHRSVVRNQQFVLRHHKTLSLNIHDFTMIPIELENRFVIHAAKHVNLISHHSDATFKIDVFQYVINLIIRAIGTNARKKSLVLRRVQHHLILKSA